MEVGGKGQTPTFRAKGDQKTQPHHSSPRAGWNSRGKGGCSPSTPAEGRWRAGIAAVRGHWRGIVAERVALLPPESLGRDSRQ